MTAIDEGCIIAVYAKPAVSGGVKTRLIPRLGAAGAARFHAVLVRQGLETALAAAVGRVQLWCADAADPALAQLAVELGVELRQQCAGDLGWRMSQTFCALLPTAVRVILVGSDCPSRLAQDFVDADAQLTAGCDAVFGPTEDGGYHLIALRRPYPTIFAQIAWSTPAVMDQTRMHLRALGLRWHELALRWDVDRSEDIDRLLADPRLASLAVGFTCARA